MNTNLFSPLFDKCSPYKLTVLYKNDKIVTVNARSQDIHLYNLDDGSIETIIDIHGRACKAIEKARDTPGTDDNASFVMEELELAAGIEDMVRKHFGASWYEGKPLIMKRKGFNQWVKDNAKFGVTPTRKQ